MVGYLEDEVDADRWWREAEQRLEPNIFLRQHERSSKRASIGQVIVVVRQGHQAQQWYLQQLGPQGPREFDNEAFRQLPLPSWQHWRSAAVERQLCGSLRPHSRTHLQQPLHGSRQHFGHMEYARIVDMTYHRRKDAQGDNRSAGLFVRMKLQRLVEVATEADTKHTCIGIAPPLSPTSLTSTIEYHLDAVDCCFIVKRSYFHHLVCMRRWTRAGMRFQMYWKGEDANWFQGTIVHVRDYEHTPVSSIPSEERPSWIAEDDVDGFRSPLNSIMVLWDPNSGPYEDYEHGEEEVWVSPWELKPIDKNLFTPALPNWESSTQLEDWHLDPLAARIAHARAQVPSLPSQAVSEDASDTQRTILAYTSIASSQGSQQPCGRAHHCALCDKRGRVNVRCQDCTTAYHLGCLTRRLRYEAHVRGEGTLVSSYQLQRPTWRCHTCIRGTHTCAVCGELFHSSQRKLPIHCAVRGCGWHYHIPCLHLIRAHLPSLQEQDEFVCPAHFCAQCKLPFVPGVDTDTRVCWRCPRAYHTRCMPQEARSIPGVATGLCECPTCFAAYRSARHLLSLRHQHTGTTTGAGEGSDYLFIDEACRRGLRDLTWERHHSATSQANGLEAQPSASGWVANADEQAVAHMLFELENPEGPKGPGKRSQRAAPKRQAGASQGVLEPAARVTTGQRHQRKAAQPPQPPPPQPPLPPQQPQALLPDHIQTAVPRSPASMRRRKIAKIPILKLSRTHAVAAMESDPSQLQARAERLRTNAVSPTRRLTAPAAEAQTPAAAAAAAPAAAAAAGAPGRTVAARAPAAAARAAAAPGLDMHASHPLARKRSSSGAAAPPSSASQRRKLTHQPHETPSLRDLVAQLSDKAPGQPTAAGSQGDMAKPRAGPMRQDRAGAAQKDAWANSVHGTAVPRPRNGVHHKQRGSAGGGTVDGQENGAGTGGVGGDQQQGVDEPVPYFELPIAVELPEPEPMQAGADTVHTHTEEGPCVIELDVAVPPPPQEPTSPQTGPGQQGAGMGRGHAQQREGISSALDAFVSGVPGARFATGTGRAALFPGSGTQNQGQVANGLQGQAAGIGMAQRPFAQTNGLAGARRAAQHSTGVSVPPQPRQNGAQQGAGVTFFGQPTTAAATNPLRAVPAPQPTTIASPPAAPPSHAAATASAGGGQAGAAAQAAGMYNTQQAQGPGPSMTAGVSLLHSLRQLARAMHQEESVEFLVRLVGEQDLLRDAAGARWRGQEQSMLTMLKHLPTICEAALEAVKAALPCAISELAVSLGRPPQLSDQAVSDYARELLFRTFAQQTADRKIHVMPVVQLARDMAAEMPTIARANPALAQNAVSSPDLLRALLEGALKRCARMRVRSEGMPIMLSKYTGVKLGAVAAPAMAAGQQHAAAGANPTQASQQPAAVAMAAHAARHASTLAAGGTQLQPHMVPMHAGTGAAQGRARPNGPVAPGIMPTPGSNAEHANAHRRLSASAPQAMSALWEQTHGQPGASPAQQLQAAAAAEHAHMQAALAAQQQAQMHAAIAAQQAQLRAVLAARQQGAVRGVGLGSGTGQAPAHQQGPLSSAVHQAMQGQALPPRYHPSTHHQPAAAPGMQALAQGLPVANIAPPADTAEAYRRFLATGRKVRVQMPHAQAGPSTHPVPHQRQPQPQLQQPDWFVSAMAATAHQDDGAADEDTGITAALKLAKVQTMAEERLNEAAFFEEWVGKCGVSHAEAAQPAVREGMTAALAARVLASIARYIEHKHGPVRAAVYKDAAEMAAVLVPPRFAHVVERSDAAAEHAGAGMPAQGAHSDTLAAAQQAPQPAVAAVPQEAAQAASPAALQEDMLPAAPAEPTAATDKGVSELQGAVPAPALVPTTAAAQPVAAAASQAAQLAQLSTLAEPVLGAYGAQGEADSAEARATNHAEPAPTREAQGAETTQGHQDAFTAPSATPLGPAKGTEGAQGAQGEAAVLPLELVPLAPAAGMASEPAQPAAGGTSDGAAQQEPAATAAGEAVPEAWPAQAAECPAEAPAGPAEGPANTHDTGDMQIDTQQVAQVPVPPHVPSTSSDTTARPRHVSIGEAVHMVGVDGALTAAPSGSQPSDTRQPAEEGATGDVPVDTPPQATGPASVPPQATDAASALTAGSPRTTITTSHRPAAPLEPVPTPINTITTPGPVVSPAIPATTTTPSHSGHTNTAEPTGSDVVPTEAATATEPAPAAAEASGVVRASDASQYSAHVTAVGTPRPDEARQPAQLPAPLSDAQTDAQARGQGQRQGNVGTDQGPGNTPSSEQQQPSPEPPITSDVHTARMAHDAAASELQGMFGSDAEPLPDGPAAGSAQDVAGTNGLTQELAQATARAPSPEVLGSAAAASHGPGSQAAPASQSPEHQPAVQPVVLGGAHAVLECSTVKPEPPAGDRDGNQGSWGPSGVQDDIGVGHDASTLQATDPGPSHDITPDHPPLALHPSPVQAGGKVTDTNTMSGPAVLPDDQVTAMQQGQVQPRDPSTVTHSGAAASMGQAVGVQGTQQGAFGHAESPKSTAAMSFGAWAGPPSAGAAVANGTAAGAQQQAQQQAQSVSEIEVIDMTMTSDDD